MGRLRIRDAAEVLQTVKAVRMRDSANQLISIKRVRVRDPGGTLRVIFSNVSVVVVPTAVEGITSTGIAADIATSAATATPSGGTSPYTYAWAIKGTSPYTWTISAPASASTLFTATAVPVGAVATAIFTVTVTDATGAIVKADVTANARNGNTGSTGTGSVGTGAPPASDAEPAPGGGYGGPPTVYP